MIEAGRGSLERWLERGNRNGNKLPDEGYWKYSIVTILSKLRLYFGFSHQM